MNPVGPGSPGDPSGGMDGPGKFAHLLTKDDFVLGQSVSDLIWMDQVNGTISKEEAVYQYLCALLVVNPPCLNPRYLQESNLQMSRMDGVASAVFTQLEHALHDPDISEQTKSSLRPLLEGPGSAPSALRAKAAPALHTPGRNAIQALEVGGQIGSLIADAWAAFKSNVCLTAQTPTSRTVNICWQDATDLLSETIAKIAQASVQSPDGPWADFYNLFAVEPHGNKEGADFWIYVSPKFGISHQRCLYAQGGDGSVIMLAANDFVGHQNDFLRDSLKVDATESMRGTVAHELFHSFECEYAKGLFVQDPFVETNAQFGIEVGASSTREEHNAANVFLRNTTKGFARFKDDKGYFLYLWPYYLDKRYPRLSKIKDFFTAVFRQGTGALTWMEQTAREDSNLLGFAVTLLNLNREFPDKGVITFNDKDPGGYPPFMLPSRTVLGLLPDGSVSDRMTYLWTNLEPLSFDYLPLVALKGVDMNGIWPSYTVEPKFGNPQVQLGVLAIKTDPYNRKQYQVLDYKILPSSGSSPLCFEGFEERPDLLVLVFANPSKDTPSSAQITVTGRPTCKTVKVQGTYHRGTSEMTENGGKAGQFDVAIEGGEIEYQPNSGNEETFAWSDVQGHGRQTTNTLKVTCPTKDQVKWKAVKGTVRVVQESHEYSSKTCDSNGDGVLDVTLLNRDDFAGSETYNLADVGSIEYSLDEPTETFSLNVDVGSTWKLNHRWEHPACKGNGDSGSGQEESPWSWTDSVPEDQNRYRAGTRQLKFEQNSTTSDERSTLQIDFTESALSLKNIDVAAAKDLVYGALTNQPSPRTEMNGQLVPWLIDDLLYFLVWPNCAVTQPSDLNNLRQQTEQLTQEAERALQEANKALQSMPQP